jgi:hypothetical protein
MALWPRAKGVARGNGMSGRVPNPAASTISRLIQLRYGWPVSRR